MKKNLILLMVTGLVLTGCGSKEAVDVPTADVNVKVESTAEPTVTAEPADTVATTEAVEVTEEVVEPTETAEPTSTNESTEEVATEERTGYDMIADRGWEIYDVHVGDYKYLEPFVVKQSIVTGTDEIKGVTGENMIAGYENITGKGTLPYDFGYTVVKATEETTANVSKPIYDYAGEDFVEYYIHLHSDENYLHCLTGITFIDLTTGNCVTTGTQAEVGQAYLPVEYNGEIINCPLWGTWENDEDDNGKVDEWIYTMARILVPADYDISNIGIMFYGADREMEINTTDEGMQLKRDFTVHTVDDMGIYAETSMVTNENTCWIARITEGEPRVDE